MTALKVALVYDWADTRYGGAEKVLLALKKIYPQAALYTAFVARGQVPWLKKFKVVKTSFLQYLPASWRRNKALIAPLMPLAFESFDLSAYDLVISVCSFAAKGVITTPTQKHYCYLLTPTRFLYSHPEQYRSAFLRFLTRPLTRYLRRFERAAIWRPDKIIVLSRLVAERCQKYYHRAADAIIYPVLADSYQVGPAGINRTSKSAAAAPPRFLSVSRLVGYKRVDLAVRACAKLNLPLTVIGTGPELAKLEHLAQAAPQIEFLGNVDQKTLNNCYNNATALLAPGEEDFGLNIIEANQAGLWVIAHGKSGATELLNREQIWPLAAATLKETVKTLQEFTAAWQAQKMRPAKIADLEKKDFVLTWKKLVGEWQND
ncbi:MAG: glycosyltransferase [bacterium]|nr:glycosyltransferase [bacterium]